MKKIFEPVKLDHLELKNRLVRSATWEGIANPDGSVTEEAYCDRAGKTDHKRAGSTRRRR